MNRMQAAEQLRRALQMFAAGLNEEQAMEVAAVYDSWCEGKTYAAGEFLICGVNGVGDPQLYKVAQNHTAQADWTPDKTPALYTAIGLNGQGYPVWSQPAGVHDAYHTGDLVSYGGKLYRSLADGNVYAPDTYPAGWEMVQA